VRNRRTRVFAFNLLLLALLAGLALPPGARAQAAEPVIAVLGDSLAAGFGLAAEAAFPARLEAGLRARGVAVRVINAGVSGDTSAGGLARLDWTLDGSPGLVPDLVIVELGSNDALRGLDPAETLVNLDAILTAIRDRGMTAMLAGMMAPRNLGREYAEDFDSIYPRLAEKHAIVLYPFFLDCVALDPALNQGDLIHPNGAGVGIIVERIIPFVLRALEGGP
jgi:acyl-CoA thioesterase-1